MSPKARNPVPMREEGADVVMVVTSLKLFWHKLNCGTHRRYFFVLCSTPAAPADNVPLPLPNTFSRALACFMRGYWWTDMV